jgi:hypothetical protein
MASFWTRRQAIIDGYLSESGRNLFVPSEFIDWLQGQPEHEAFEWFYGKSDAETAREHRIWMARRMANGLRITAEVSTAPGKGQVVSVSVREFPAYLSPVASRRDGGGYQPFDPNDAAAMAELRRQGAVAMRSWLNRYGGAFAGENLRALEKIAAQAEPERVAKSA